MHLFIAHICEPSDRVSSIGVGNYQGHTEGFTTGGFSYRLSQRCANASQVSETGKSPSQRHNQARVAQLARAGAL